MELRSFFVRDDQGNTLGGATCYLYMRGTESLVTGLQAANGTALANPFTADAKGLIQFAAPNELYDLRVVKGARDYRVRVQCNDVEEGVAEAETAASRAEMARDVAQLSAGGGADTAAGLAGTASGKYFSVPSAEANELLVLYRNNSGVADERKRYPSAAAVIDLHDDPQRPAARALPWILEPLLAAIVASDSRRTWLESLRSDGGPSAWAEYMMRTMLGVALASAPLLGVADADVDAVVTYAPDKTQDSYVRGDETLPVLPNMLQISGWGSSTIQEFKELGALSKSFGASYYNGGAGGEWSSHIAARMGSIPALLTVVGGEIPASGSVEVLSSNVSPLASFKPTIGTLNGIDATLSSTKTTWTLTRTTPGSAVPTIGEFEFLPTLGLQHRADVSILNLGKNDITAGQPVADVIRRTDASYDWLAPFVKRAIVLGQFNNVGATNPKTRASIAALNAHNAERYGRQFFDLGAYLTGSQVWIDTGITPTATDLTEQAAGNIPPSLTRDNFGHMNATARGAVKNKLINLINSLGWYDGESTYTGGTSLNEGTLSINADSSLGAPSGPLTIGNGTLHTQQTFATNRLVALSGGASFSQAVGTDFTLNGVLSGSGSLTQNGTGTLVLNGANTYTGGTRLNGGTLSISADSNLGAPSGPLIIGSGTLHTQQALATNRLVALSGDAALSQAVGTDFTLNGVLSGSGSLTQNGAGTLVLNGANTYTGGTRINGGTLSISADSNLGAPSGPLTIGNGTLDTRQTLATSRLVALSGDASFSQAVGTDFTLNGVLSGPGSLTQNGAGTLVLNGANTYTGGTRINGGTLSISADSNLGALSGPLTIGNGTLDTRQTFATNRLVALTDDALFRQAVGTDFTLNGVLGGSGSLALNGGGSVTLNASNIYTGVTNLNSGALFVNGSLASSSQLATNPATFLGGIGTLPQTKVGGSVSPGPALDTSGTLTIAGSLTTAPTANYIVDFNPSGAHDLIHATGSAALNNAGATTVLHGFVPVVNQPFAILTADGGVNGTFTYPTQHLPLADVGLTYDANNVYFLVARNEVPIGGGVDELPPDNSIFGAIVRLPTVGEIRNALDQLSGQIYPSLKTLMLEDSHFVRDALYERLDAQGGEPLTPILTSDRTVQLAPNLTAWVRGVGAHRKQGDLSDETGGTFLGFDSRITDTTTLGVLVGYTQSDVDGSYSSATGDNYTLGAYAGTLRGPWSLKAGAAYTFNEIDSSRSVDFTGFSDSLSEEYSAATAQVFGSVGYTLGAGPAVVEPYADIAWVNVRTDDFTEQGGPAALRVDGGDEDAIFSTLGVRPSYKFVASDMPMKVKGGLGWRHTFGDLEPSDSMAFAPTSTFGIPGIPLAEDVAVVSLGVEAALASNIDLSLSYNGQIASGDTQENGVTALLRMQF